MIRRRNPIRIGIRGNSPLIPPSVNNGLISYDDIIGAINTSQAEAAQKAYDLYNANYYNRQIQALPTIGELTTIQVPDATRVEKPVVVNTGKKRRYIPGSNSEFVNNIYDSYYKAVRPNASSDEDAARQARFLTQKAAFETGYGHHIANTHNYGGHRRNGQWLKFSSMDAFTRRDVALLDKKWSNWRNAKNENEFVNSITSNQGQGHYAPRAEYEGYFGLTNRTRNYLNMRNRSLRCGGKISRPKAWIGAAIGAATSIIGSIISSNAEKARLEEQRRMQEHKDAVERAQNLTESLGLTQAAQKEYEDRFRVNYRNGGRRRLRDGVSITDGGPVLNLSTGGLYYAGDKVPYGEYVDLGPTHEERNSSGKTGTGWNINGKKIETENKEVETISPTQMKVYSNSLELPNGMTPAEYVLNGGDENYAFNVQQNMNGDYRIGNKRRLRNGGCLSHPVGRIKADDGIVVLNGRILKRVNYKNADGTISDKTYLQDIGPADGGTSWWTNLKNRVKGALNAKVQAPPAKRTTTGTRAANPNAQTGPFYSSTMASTFKPKTTNIKPSTSGGGVRSNNTSGNSGSGVRGNSQTVEEPATQSAYAQQYDKNNTRSLVVSSGTGRRRLASRGATPNIGEFTVPELESPYKSQPVEFDKEIMARDMDLYRGLSDDEITAKELGFGKTVPSAPANTDTDVVGNNTNKWGTSFKGSDWIGLGADVIGSLGSALIQSSVAGSVEDPRRPVLLSPAKLITNYNIAPRLQNVRNTRLNMLRDSDEAVSSAGRLTRRNQINLATNQASNELWGEKTNKEVELLNADALNQQQVHKDNVAYLNDYYNRLAEARNRRALLRGNAWQIGLSGLSDAVGNFLDQGKQRYADQQAMRYYSALLPEEGRQWLRRNRVDFLRRGGKIS